MTIIPPIGKYVGVVFLLYEIDVPGQIDMHLFVVCICYQDLVISLLSHYAIIAVTVTDSGSPN